LGFGFWGLGFGGWGIGPNPQSPNPQSPSNKSDFVFKIKFYYNKINYLLDLELLILSK